MAVTKGREDAARVGKLSGEQSGRFQLEGQQVPTRREDELLETTGSGEADWNSRRILKVEVPIGVS